MLEKVIEGLDDIPEETEEENKTESAPIKMFSSNSMMKLDSFRRKTSKMQKQSS
jgi:hypothetical protein